MKYLSALKRRDLEGKIVLLSADLNIENEYLKSAGKNLRVAAILPTLEYLRKNGAKIVLMSHRGRPAPIENQSASWRMKIENFEEFTLRPFAGILSKLAKTKVEFVECDFKEKRLYTEKDVLKINSARAGAVFLLEDVRFFGGEEKDDRDFAKKLAALGDIYVNDAFGTDHRRHASLVAITEFLPSYAGLLLEKEMRSLDKAVENPKRPISLIIGGAKVSDKLGLIENFRNKADYFILAGGPANTFFVAEGLPVGDSLYEAHMVNFAKKVKKDLGAKIRLPKDLVIKDRKILDIGENTVKEFTDLISKSKTVIWSGPLGEIEDEKYAKGSKAIAAAIMRSKAFCIIGGGETSTLFSGKKIGKNVFLSTGGGAMLEYLSGMKLPGIEALR